MGTGYDPYFLSGKHSIPLPALLGNTASGALDLGKVFDFCHFSIVMNRQTKFAIFSAACVDKSKAIPITRDNTSWHFDDRIGIENQVGPEYYAENEYDRGHLTRRKDVCWGEPREAKQANYDSFCYANIALQHHNFNTGIWNCLEDWVLERVSTQRLIVITGPIHKAEDEEYCGVHGAPGCAVRVPFGFWKSVFYLDDKQQVACLSFLIRQSPERSNNRCEYQRLITYQVPLATISKEAELQFEASLYEKNPLYRRVSFATPAHDLPAPRLKRIWHPADIVLDES
ncbi:DNA/RNA non-specific endonuclease [Brevibacillus sp. NRS-1366]|uniref:DNA/RNA non-specific endonuclease n=1 Tax=Brevibacillus sp. NRS-1366 TaxID=3233899 RepID=UPI003D21CE1C